MSTATRRAARAVADLAAGTVHAEVEVGAPPERVFRALTTDEVTRWWGSDGRYRVTSWTADLRVGGSWRAEGRGADGVPFTVEGEFVAIDPARRLVLTWRAPWDGGQTTTVSYLLEATAGGGTRLTLRHEGFSDRRGSCADHARGWELVLEWLAQYVGPADARHFFIRLIPPRATFMRDMTDVERAAMMEHRGYWQARLEAGDAVVFGPVADPAGGWGLGVVRAADEAGVRSFEAQDPAVTRLGMHYQVLPMVAAVYRGA